MHLSDKAFYLTAVSEWSYYIFGTTCFMKYQEVVLVWHNEQPVCHSRPCKVQVAASVCTHQGKLLNANWCAMRYLSFACCGVGLWAGCSITNSRPNGVAPMYQTRPSVYTYLATYVHTDFAVGKSIKSMVMVWLQHPHAANWFLQVGYLQADMVY